MSCSSSLVHGHPTPSPLSTSAIRSPGPSPRHLISHLVCSLDHRHRYGVILTDGEHDFGAIGLDGERVYTVRHQDIAAVVSSHPATSIKPLRRNLAPFHQTLRHVSTQHTTIPAKFGQIAEDDAQVRRLLEAHYESLKAELERLHAKGEIGLKVSWAVDNLSAYLVESDEELRRFRGWLQSRGSPPSRQEQIELGGRVYDWLNARRQAMSQLVLRSLRQTSAESRLDDPTEDHVLSAAAFHVAHQQRADFEEAVTKMAALLGPEYMVKIDGPWPPYHFSPRLA